MQDNRIDKYITSLWLVSSELVTYVEKKIKPLGLTIHDLRAIIVLGERGPLSPSDLADALGLTNGAVTGIVNRLLAIKAVKRDPNGNDKRRRLITLQFSQLDTVLMDITTTARSTLNTYSDANLQVIEQYNHDTLQLLRQAREKEKN